MTAINKGVQRFKGSSGGEMAIGINSFSAEHMDQRTAIYLEVLRNGAKGFITLSLSQVEVLQDDLVRLVELYKEQEPKDKTAPEIIEAYPVGTLFKLESVTYLRTSSGVIISEGFNAGAARKITPYFNGASVKNLKILHTPDEA